MGRGMLDRLQDTPPDALLALISQFAALGQRIVEEGAEHLLAPAIAHRVLFPYRGIGGDGIERVPIVRRQWPQAIPLPFEDRLPVHVRRRHPRGLR